MSKIKIKLLELFGGIGAPRKSLNKLNKNIESVDYVEINNYAVKAYNKIFNQNHSPISVLDWNKYDSDVDLLVHGSPCQDFSVAGKNDLSTGRSILYTRTLEIIKNLHNRPKYVVWENVKGLLNKNSIEHFHHYLKSMDQLGYINHWKVLNSKDFGIPQSRERVFVVSIRKDVKNDFSFDNLITKPMKHLNQLLENHETVDENHYITVKRKFLIKNFLFGKLKILNDFAYTINTKQMGKIMPGIIKVPVGKFDVKNYQTYEEFENGKFKVWVPKDLSQRIVVMIDNQPYHLRILTYRETYRLMGFDDEDFDKISDFPVTHLQRLAGNSIVVDVLVAIFEELFKKSEK